MKIGIIGAGNMGAGLGKLWAKAGHQVVFSYSRDENKLWDLATSAGATAKAATVQEAAAQDVILIAVWLPALAEVIDAAGTLDGKIVITCISGLQPDFTGQTIGLATDLKISVAETIQQLIPHAKVVEAFNTTFAEIIASDSRKFGSDVPSVFYCGDDSEAKQITARLIEDCGYEAVDAGNLLVARTLETLATAWVQFAVASQQFPNLGLKAVRR
ncbi:NADPH-dependent F420 reductase [Kovacikia minuta CCNUW1]|uniref:NADPH-dependent F420 reductase n=1 Tax=Kovacikia minuta TaxID=2931930 RepID=UPI001CCE8AB3|nr:NADPH-dependent F420 reductase [Kovacikia minuta]UBF26825.1 NADPH-dependent F420 reductase [Kovacikia minuta CCNUW1]